MKITTAIVLPIITFCFLFYASSTLRAQSIGSVSPNKGELGETLNVFISGQNVNFTNGSNNIQVNFQSGGATLQAPVTLVQSNLLGVSVDLTDRTLPSGFYDLAITGNTSLSLTNAFEIDTTNIRNISPKRSIVGLIENFLIVGEGVDFGTITTAPRLTLGSNIISTTIIGARGTDTLEIQVDFSTPNLQTGSYDLTVFAPSDTLYYASAIHLASLGLSAVNPDKGQIGESLNVFISGQNTTFLSGSSTIPNTPTTFRNGSTILFPTIVGANAAGDVLEVSLDLTNPTLPTGFYDVSVNTLNNGTLTIVDGFEVNSQVIRSMNPSFAAIGNTVNFTLIGEGINFNSVTIPPQFSNGSQTINTSIVSVPGNNSIEIQANFQSVGLTTGSHDLLFFIGNDTLYLRNALQLNPFSGITSVNPNTGKIGDILPVFISGQNVNFASGSSTIQTTFSRGNTNITAPFVSSNSGGTVLEVLLDLSNTSYPTGNYDLTVNTTSNGTLTFPNAFLIDSLALIGSTPNRAIIGQSINVLITGRNIDFNTVTIPPRYIFGGTSISTSLVGTRGNDTLEISVNLIASNLVAGNYDLQLFVPNDTLTLRNALDLRTTNISGNVYYDTNNNGIQDLNELGLNNVQLTLLPGNIVSFTNNNGNYSFSDLQSGIYNVVIKSPDSTFITTPPDTQQVVIGIPGDYNVSYGINSNSRSIVNNTSILLYSNRARCAALASYLVNIQNNGFTSSNGIYKMIKAPALNFDPSSIAIADSVKGDSIFFSFSNLLPGEQRTQAIQCMLPGVNILGVGDSVLASAEIFQTDNIGKVILGTKKNNNDGTIVRCSFDPNDKLVSPSGVDSLRLTLHNTLLEYTIRFQNTGNDTAYKVVIRDTLSPFLDPNTFEFLTATHNVNVQLNNNRELVFTFNNIFLVDSTTNEPASNGLVKFRIQPLPNLIDSSKVINRAGIFFDSNPPIITNEVLNTYVSTITSIKELESQLNVNIYPNPNNGWFNIETDQNILKGQLIVYDLQGKIVYQQDNLNGSQWKINLDNRENGVYFIHLIDNKNSLMKKIIKQ